MANIVLALGKGVEENLGEKKNQIQSAFKKEKDQENIMSFPKHPSREITSCPVNRHLSGLSSEFVLLRALSSESVPLLSVLLIQ
jgi:hypothetical protein